MLRSNTGSKDSIINIRRWVLKRAHSIVAIGILFESYAKSVCAVSADSEVDFLRLLHLVYVINDILFNSKSASTSGPYTTVVPVAREVNITAAILPRVTIVMNTVYHCCRCDAEREKLLKIISLWENKKIMDSASCRQLKRDMTLPYCAKLEVTPPYLEHPFVTELPPKQLSFVSSARLSAESQADFTLQPVGGAGVTTSIAPIERHVNLHAGQSSFRTDDMSVGYCAILSQAGLKAGLPAYSPIDIKFMDPSLPASIVEPGRLDARLREYFRKVNDI